MLNFDALISTLPIALKGMAGVFGVILAIWASIEVLIRVFKH